MNRTYQIEGRAFPLGRANIDTDIIISAEHLKTLTRVGLGKHAFEVVKAEPGNPFDDPDFVGATILIAGDNFGCGSSREHAAWAIADMGIRAVIAPSFSDIFAGNAFRNGIATIELPQPAVDRLLAVARTDSISVDLETLTVTTSRQDRFPFDLDPFRLECLKAGADEIGFTRKFAGKIKAFEDRVSRQWPWLASVGPPAGPGVR